MVFLNNFVCSLIKSGKKIGWAVHTVRVNIHECFQIDNAPWACLMANVGTGVLEEFDTVILHIIIWKLSLFGQWLYWSDLCSNINTRMKKFNLSFGHGTSWWDKEDFIKLSSVDSKMWIEDVVNILLNGAFDVWRFSPPKFIILYLGLVEEEEKTHIYGPPNPPLNYQAHLCSITYMTL